MFPFVTKRRLLLAALSIATLVNAGCGGAEARKAKHLAKGQSFLQEGSFEKARVEFRNALQIAPKDSEARYENGVADERLGNPREAAQFYQGAIDTNPDNILARANLARLYLFSGAPDRALEIIKPSLEKHPDDADLLTVRAAARTQLKDPDGALQDAERAVALAPGNENAVGVLAGIYIARHDSQRARTLLEGAVKLIPATVDLRLALAQVYSGLGQNEQAEATLIELVRLRPNDKAQRLRLAQYYARLNQIDAAERVLREAIKALPNEPVLKADLVQLLAAHRGRDVAEKELSALVAASPKDYPLRFAQAQFYEQGKQVDKAKGVYDEIIESSGTEAAGVTARNRLAALLIEKNDIPAAEKLIAQVLGNNPRDNDALILRGNLALAQKDPKTAIADLRSVLRDQPNAVGVMRELARAHLANGEPALAEETMRRAVDANPRDTAARLDLAQLLMTLGKPEQAKPVIDELVKQEPSNMVALDAQFHVAAATMDYATAKAAADTMVATQPKNGIGYYYQALVAETEKRPEDAVRLYSQSLDLQPEAVDALSGITRVLAGMNRTPEALKRLDEVSARFPKYPLALDIKGELLLATHHVPEAETAFKSAIEREPKWWKSYGSLALAQRSANDLPSAVATLQNGIAKADQPQSLEMELADVLQSMGKSDDAIQVYETALRKEPQNDLIANNLAMLLITAKSDPASVERARQLSERFAHSTNASYLDTYGWVLYKRGDTGAAVAALQTAVEKTPDSVVSLYHLGMAQASAGESEAARQTLSRCLKSGKSFAGMDEAKATLDKLAKLTAAATATGS